MKKYRSQAQLMFALCLCHAGNLVWADNSWTFQQENDRLNNQVVSTAQSPRPRIDLYDNIKLALVCRDNKLQMVLNSDVLIASQNSPFEVEYQIDKNPPLKVMLQTFPDSKRKGFLDKQVDTLVSSILTGETLFLKVNTMIRKVLTAAIPLEGADAAINKVLAECQGAANKAPVAVPDYTYDKFQQELQRLTPEQQQKLLLKFQALLRELAQ